MSDAPRLLTGLRDRRYGEVFLVFLEDGARAEVYNSFLLNDCPDDLWRALEPTSIAARHGAAAAVLNGPRHWMMDGIGKVDAVEPVIRDFGGIAMRRVATLALGDDLERVAYREREVHRGAAWHFDAGRPVYELLTGDGATYVLQAYCTAVDATLDVASLATLGSRLRLPKGWRFRERVLDEELIIDTTRRPGVVLQDEFENTYTKFEGAAPDDSPTLR